MQSALFEPEKPLHWRQQVEPWAKIWSQVVEHAKSRGLVHGQFAVNLVMQAAQGRYAAHPADAADLLRDMVKSGVLKPMKLDLAASDYSVRALRCLDGAYHRGRGASNQGERWEPTDAHLWTYQAGGDEHAAG